MADKQFLKPWEFEDGADRDKTIVIVIASILLGLGLYWFQDEIGADTTVLIAVIVGLVNAFTLIVKAFTRPTITAINTVVSAPISS